MRLGLVRYKYDQGGGAERTLGLLARGLLERGHQVHLVTSAWQGAAPPGLRIRLVPPAGPARWARAAAQSAAGLGLDTWLSLERVPGSPLFRAGDGVHAAWLARRAPYEPLMKRLSFGLNPKHRSLLELERRTLGAPQLRGVIAVSRLVAGELQEYYGVPADKIKVIYNGVDEQMLASAREAWLRQDARRELSLEPGRPALLFLGSGWERKGLAFALAALVRLKDALLLVAGRDRPQAWQARAARLGVAERVRWLGLRTDVAALLAGCDALVLPSIYDPCPNSALEALYAGLPVVTTQAAGACELLEPGKSGVVVSRADAVEELAAACQAALGLPRGFVHRVPGQQQWLGQVVAVLEAAAAAQAKPVASQ
ncbi:MAG: glycosyltransferase family 1 protein [Desulfarculus sp.]|nr:MAG: glycosyltransferase family 1 protein [Desulfarculus sp.]